MTQKAWDVFLNGLWIDTVFFNSNLDEDYVRNSLVCHDHYNPDITIKVQKTMNPNFMSDSFAFSRYGPTPYIALSVHILYWPRM